MEDSFQFIIESPQHSQGHKKRPRLVTSCDNCRLKKIKCLQPSPESKCEACKAAKIACRFRDRERYFAERSRAIAGPNSSVYATELRSEPSSTLDAFSVASGSSSPSLSSSDPRSNSHSPKASGMVSADIEHSGRYPSYAPDSRHIGPSHGHSSSISSFDSLRSNTGVPPYNNFVGHTPPLYPTVSRNSYQGDQRPIQLFDPENPQRPHPNLMTHFIQVFFDRHGQDFTFLTYQDVLADFWEQRLSLILANCIAAMAVKYSNISEFSARDLHNVAENYIDIAKHLLTSMAHIPSLETLHGLMLLCWLEHNHHRLPGFRTYYGMAGKMANDLGLQDPHNLELYPSEYERSRRRATWNGMVQLHITANSFRS
ncbi:hypothetical protein JR316_0002109 [Psilocybe cubensis]|uniref:Uncharacterized protein n=2 Tax=Psilocybe cubensis TaxID=181762 RepID=A0ACB8HC24_PSICU|nr:hypothetical protein JR316_0002109 [Psilocybe cubensis]KAH9485202.1 hypothetical protein JR316_0002109 [Psilocybe cubensis]